MRALLRTMAGATIAAALLAVAVHAIATRVAGDLVVTPPGADAEPVSAAAAAVAAVLAGVGATVVAALAGRARRPRAVFLAAGLAVLGVSFASPVAAAEEWDTAAWLVSMHLVVAAVLLPAGARLLPRFRGGGPRPAPADAGAGAGAGRPGRR